MRVSSIDVIAAALEPLTADLGRGLSSPDGAVTLMLGDLADPGAVVALDADRWERIVADHNLLVERIVAAHDGTVVKFQRDGFLAQFNSAHAGLHAAVELQRTFAGGIGTEQRGLTARSGLHSGFVIATGADQPMGRNAVLTARIAAQAKGGEILVSSTLKQYTQTDPSFHFEERGEFHFKGMLGEHTVYAVHWR